MVRSQMEALEGRVVACETGGADHGGGGGGGGSEARITHVERQVLGMKNTMKDFLVRHPNP